ncbi:MAG: hypothetical protein NZ888_05165 [Candidatus Nitrosocaldus sp.]|nr:hypothetical protein [Candidatus Nitrosocaldus sp.]MCS7141556.1 hypothetical protein [Candidatus Nitrosocaldus sp.]MDW8000324.1 hypothetical protein [Candidatus Nitrosocaldus sp.]
MCCRKRCGAKYSYIDIRMAILKHDIRRAARACSVTDSMSTLACLDRLVNDINIPDRLSHASNLTRHV